MSLVTVLGLASLASASVPLFARNNPPQPPCVYPYTPFVYSGCFTDSVSSRALPFMTELEFNNATVEQCTSYCKGNGYRYAGLEYYGQCFCGASVSATSAPEEECNLPCNGDGDEACGGQDRISIYQDPTFPDADDIGESGDYKSLGCYTEGSSGRSLDYSQWDYLDADAMTTETCLTACGDKGYPFAGTEFGRECYCGVVLGNGTEPADASECSTPCTGNADQYCGGPNRLSLYVAKNLESTEPCGPPIISSSSIPSSTPTPTSSSSSSSSSTPIVSTTSSCVGYNCPKSSSTSTPVKTSTSKCVGWYCPPPTPSCKTSTSTPAKSTSTSTKKTTTSTKPSSTTPCKTSSTSTKKSSTTLKTTTPCKTSTTTKTSSTPKPTSTKKYPWEW